MYKSVFWRISVIRNIFLFWTGQWEEKWQQQHCQSHFHQLSQDLSSTRRPEFIGESKIYLKDWCFEPFLARPTNIFAKTKSCLFQQSAHFGCGSRNLDVDLGFKLQFWKSSSKKFLQKLIPNLLWLLYLSMRCTSLKNTSMIREMIKLLVHVRRCRLSLLEESSPTGNSRFFLTLTNQWQQFF